MECEHALQVKPPREHLDLSKQTGSALQSSGMLQQSSELDADTFASMLSNLTRSRQQAAQAKAVGELSLSASASQSQACCTRQNLGLPRTGRRDIIAPF